LTAQLYRPGSASLGPAIAAEHDRQDNRDLRALASWRSSSQPRLLGPWRSARAGPGARVIAFPKWVIHFSQAAHDGPARERLRCGRDASRETVGAPRDHARAKRPPFGVGAPLRASGGRAANLTQMDNPFGQKEPRVRGGVRDRVSRSLATTTAAPSLSDERDRRRNDDRAILLRGPRSRRLSASASFISRQCAAQRSPIRSEARARQLRPTPQDGHVAVSLTQTGWRSSSRPVSASST
jgi:hypothetical protein